MKKFILIGILILGLAGMVSARMKIGKDGAWLITDTTTNGTTTYTSYQNAYDNDFYILQNTSETYRYFRSSLSDYDAVWSSRTLWGYQQPKLVR